MNPGHTPVAGILGDVLAAEKLAKHVPLRASQRVEADVAVGRRQHVAGARAGADAGIALGDDASVFVPHRRYLGTREHGLLHTHIDVFAGAMARSAEHRQLRRGGRVGTRKGFGNGATDLQRLALRDPAQSAPATYRAGNQMGRLIVRIGSERAETRYGGENHGRIRALERLVADTPGLECLGSFARDDNVELLHQSAQLLAPLRRSGVQDHAALAGIEIEERSTGFAPRRGVMRPCREWPDRTGFVARIGPFDLHDVGSGREQPQHLPSSPRRLGTPGMRVGHIHQPLNVGQQILVGRAFA